MVAVYCEGVPTVVFEISPSRVKTFHCRPDISTTTNSYPHAVRRLCVGSVEDRRVRRPSHRILVQSPILTAHINNIKIYGIGCADIKILD
jgi:hypothetical protein